MADEANYSFNVPLPKASQYDPTTQLTVRADDSTEFKNRIDALFGQGTFDRLVGLGLKTILALGVEEGPTPPTPAPGPAIGSGPAPAAAVPGTTYPGGATGTSPDTSAESFGACPECGVGQVVNKFRTAAKGGGFMGRGCNNYPGCKYMQYWSN